MSFKLRDYQEKRTRQGLAILKKHGLVYLLMEVRTGKTHTALAIADRFGAKNVLFLTKKKAISSIEKDFATAGYGFNLQVINDDMLLADAKRKEKNPDAEPRVMKCPDLVIHDEHHRFAGFPKYGKATKLFRDKYRKLPQIYLSGTMTPENYSQIYHQFWVSDNTPFKPWPTFYKWAKAFVDITEKHVGQAHPVKDYSQARIEEVQPFIEPYLVKCTQAEAGFSATINEHFHEVKMNRAVTRTIELLKKDLVVQGREHCITADTGAALMQKIHQLGSGTIIFDAALDDPEGKNRVSKVLDPAKAHFINDQWVSKGEKVGIFYVFKHELEAIKQVMGDAITTDLDEFNATGKSIALQVVSGREGVKLSKASRLVFFNIAHSATSYWQARDRRTTIETTVSDVHWLLSDCGIEREIYAAVSAKKNYTTSMFKKYLGQTKKPTRRKAA